MEACVQLPKKCKRNFIEAWLTDERYKNWIRKVSLDESQYHCTICNRNFSCNAAHVSRHAESACHRKNVQENMSLSNDDNNDGNNVPVSDKVSKISVFQRQWLDIKDYKMWLRDVPHDEAKCFCTICEKYFAAHLSNIRRHAESKSHADKSKKKDIEASESIDDYNTQDSESRLLFDERKKAAEIQFAALIAELNIPHQNAHDILTFFQRIGQDPHVLQNMSMGRKKCQSIISNVLYPVENKRVVHDLQRTKFSVYIDETSDISNEKWMTFFVRYVDPETLDICSQLVKLINIDAKDCSAEKIFDAFKNEMWKLEIPFLNIIALSCDNASVMVGKYSSFKTKLEDMCKHVLTFPCPCHSVALAAHAACAQIPSFCEEFLRKISNYINCSPKRTAVFQEFCHSFQEKYRKILKLSETRWLSHHACVERLLESWDIITNFLQENVVSDKTKTGEYLLSMMDNIEMKAYFLFLKYVLNFFNAFNAFFQSAETRIYLLHLKSTNFLSQICINFVQEKYIKDVATSINFSQEEIYKKDADIFLGSECEEYLQDLLTTDHVDNVTSIRKNCLKFYVTAAEEIRKRLPIANNFLKMLRIFCPTIALFHNGEESLKYVCSVARTLGGFDEECLKDEWLTLRDDFTVEEKQSMSKLNFDDMWKIILQRQMPKKTYKYSTLRNLVSAVRSLPNSNADPERMFSILTDLKSKKRNRLSSITVNATCVLKSSLKTRDKAGPNIRVTTEHLSRMSSNILYADTPRREENPKI